MTTELKYLVFVSVLTALLWVPYILNLILVRGPKDAVGYPDNPKPIAPWASRLRAAHYNAVENLVVFAALILVAHAVGVSRQSTQVCAMVYFWARVVHPVAYALGIPVVRTLAFVTGWGATLCVAWAILAS